MATKKSKFKVPIPGSIVKVKWLDSGVLFENEKPENVSLCIKENTGMVVWDGSQEPNLDDQILVLASEQSTYAGTPEDTYDTLVGIWVPCIRAIEVYHPKKKRR